jgi:hypothetical protein
MDLSGYEFVPARRGLSNDGLMDVQRKRTQRRAVQKAMSKAERRRDRRIDLWRGETPIATRYCAIYSSGKQHKQSPWYLNREHAHSALRMMQAKHGNSTGGVWMD